MTVFLFLNRKEYTIGYSHPSVRAKIVSAAYLMKEKWDRGGYTVSSRMKVNENSTMETLNKG